jgi:hypothetical protein
MGRHAFRPKEAGKNPPLERNDFSAHEAANMESRHQNANQLSAAMLIFFLFFQPAVNFSWLNDSDTSTG